MTDIIWNVKLDEKYDVSVTRIDQYTGKIEIKEGTNLIASTQTPLYFGAMFGPDIDDLQIWQRWAIAVVDHPGIDVPFPVPLDWKAEEKDNGNTSE